MNRNPETQYQAIYLGRDNPFNVIPKLNGEAMPADFVITGVDLNYKDVTISSTLYPDVFDFADPARIQVNITGMMLEAGMDAACELILYSAAFPEGVVFEPILELVVLNTMGIS